MASAPIEVESRSGSDFRSIARNVYDAVGILPILMILAIVFFSVQEARFYGVANVTSQVLLRIWDVLKENGMEIPFPQRDLHFDPSAPLRVVTVSDKEP